MAKSKFDTLYRGGGMDRIRRIFPDDPAATVERPLWDSFAQEPDHVGGTPVKLYSLRRAKNHHPLYREPSAGAKDWVFQGPWQMMGTVDNELVEPQAGTEGLRKTTDVTLYMARKEYEDCGAPDPKIGDVFEFWNEKVFDPPRPKFWEVLKANADPQSFIMNSETFTRWVIQLTSRSDFDPQRKIENARI